MPPQLPDRYQFEVRLGRAGDVEEWLATDTSLDRPVLIRILGPETTAERRGDFLELVRGAAGVTHTHVASIFAADALPDGAYSVSEWAGGLTLKHRLEAGDTLPVAEFLPNAAGLAEALAALHESGVLHGAISQDAIFFSLAHPAKLAAFGSHAEGTTARKDVRDLAETLVTAVTGGVTQDVAPSQVVDGLSPGVDRVLVRAISGELDAAGFAELLRAAPSSIVPAPSAARPFSWRWVLPASILLAVAIILFIVGRSLNAENQDPLLFPVTPGPTVTTASPTSTTIADAPGGPIGASSIVSVEVFDPEGDGAEHDRELPHLTDGSITTTWNTERYDDPLPLIKSGVGFTVELSGTPAAVELLGSSNGISYRLFWAQVPASSLSEWEPVAGGSIRDGRGEVQLPPRTDGFWLIWLTDLPADQEGGFVGRIGEVRFRS